MTTVNPYELNKVYRKTVQSLKGDATAKTMRQCLSRVINASSSDYDASQEIPIEYITFPFLHDDEIDYQYLMNFLFFEGNHHQYHDLRRFGIFFFRTFDDLDWSIPSSPMPFRTFNFFMNLPFLLFNFVNVQNHNPTATASRGDSATVLGNHFIPIFTGLFDSLSIKSVMNRYYQKYTDDFTVEMKDMLQSLYSMEYKKPDQISELETGDYFINVLRPICRFISNTSDATLRVKRGNGRSVFIKNYIGTHKNKNETLLIKPDWVVYKDRQAKVIIEMKKPPLFKSFRVPNFAQTITHLSEFIIDVPSVTENEVKELLIF